MTRAVLTPGAGLIQVAKFDVDVANHATSTGRRPGTANTVSPIPEAQVASLETELRASGQPFEEVVQGQTSLLWARWVGSLKEDRTVPALPFEPVRTTADATSLWTKICVVKAVYIRGMLCVHAGEESQGREHHEALIPWLDSNRSLVVSTPQLLYWAQQLLGRVALGRMTATADTTTSTSDANPSFRLQAFRHWAILAVKNQDVTPSAYGNRPGHVSKLEMWRAYYRFLSAILQNSPELSEHISIGRSELAPELRRVETSYENELLRHVQFPKATESNTIIEEWVEEFVRNWQILCGPGWYDTDLGEGGRNSCGRNILDMLYRAATKSFHSTLILRRLFQVHKVLTEFDLAYKALDTYIELMDRARERATKSSGPATGRDSDEVYLRTIAEGIEGLCSFGRQAEAEKAYELCIKLELLLKELEPPHLNSVPNGLGFQNGEINGHHSVPAPLSPGLLEAVNRAIGIGKCHWARWTPFSENRTNLQSEATERLRIAAAQDLPPAQQLKTLYALSRLLADTREIDQAISIVKRALSSEATENEEPNIHSLQRQLIPFWHLLTLLLTSRQQFDTASQSSVAAFEQFSPPDALFGNAGGPEDGQKSSVADQKTGLVDDMECDELQMIIELRITELALTEFTEGHEQAVNSSDELLVLYSRLFRRHGVIAMNGNEEKSRTRQSQPPKSSAGTVRSLRSNLFHRKRIGRSSESSRGIQANAAPSIAEEQTRPTTQNTQTTQAPTIQVTHEGEKPPTHKHKIFHSHDHSKEEKRRSSGTLQPHDRLLPRSRSRSRSRSRGPKEKNYELGIDQSADGTGEKVPDTTPSAEAAQFERRPKLETIQSQDVPAVSVSADHHDSSEGAKQELKEIPHNLAAHDKVPLPAQHQEQPPEQDVRLPVAGSMTMRTEPIPRFPKTASQRHALSILVKIWLIIATLYRRASMFDDSREACDEAAKVAMRIEGMIAVVESSARAFSDPGWGGGGKSSDELWADVYCERAELQMAIARAREEKEGSVYSEGVREAVDQYEQCLMYFADHVGGIVGLSNVLLDYYERKVELAKRIDNGKPKTEETSEEAQRKIKHKRDSSRVSAVGTTNGVFDLDQATPTGGNAGPGTTVPSTTGKDDDLKKTPENLNRLAARDRAYGLLSSLTKLGSGWDDAQAWYALARAHELGGEVDRAKEILWWCVELEDSRPIRHWRNIGSGGYVL